jgi:pyruvate,orthophosphate dikinase
MFLTEDSPEVQGLDAKASAELLGGKGAGLMFMASNGVNVPPFVVFPTTLCVEYMKAPKTTMKKVAGSLKALTQRMTKEFGYMPLLSVRSGARVSMPGMMDTVLNVGLTPSNISQWEKRMGNSECVIDSFKRLITMYGNVVRGFDRKALEKDSLPEALDTYKRLAGEEFPGANDQLLTSIEAVFKSWGNERAKVYRKMNNIPESWGTAVVVQAMVFGNMNDQSGTGVLFTRNPDTGENIVVGEFLVNAQGEDVVAGTRTPMPLTQMLSWNKEVSEQLIAEVTKLEDLKKDAQDVEFTIQDGKLFILQTRNAKRSARAAVRIAYEMQEAGELEEPEALARVSERELDLSELPTIDPKFKASPTVKGIPACAGVKTGVVALSCAEAIELAKTGVKAILVTEETTPDDIKGMVASVGVLTMTGGSTSHAAVVARSMNLTCVVGLGDEHRHLFKSGQVISIDGSTGNVWLCEVPVIGGSNPLVQWFRTRKAMYATAPIVVKGVPGYWSDSFMLDLSDCLHFGPQYVLGLISEVQAKCQNLSCVYRQGGVSDVWLTREAAFEVLDFISSGVPTVEIYGHTKPFFEAGISTLENLIKLKSGGLLVQSIAKSFGHLEASAVEWILGHKKAEGVTFQVWGEDIKWVEYASL